MPQGSIPSNLTVYCRTKSGSTLTEMQDHPKLIQATQSIDVHVADSYQQSACGLKNWCPEQKGLRQGCIVSRASMCEHCKRCYGRSQRQRFCKGPKIQGKEIRYPRSACDTALLSQTQ
ncbi:hypothetical protein PoB_006410200 [Plakobranchus ocellatus]|uniref:Uncharacterized protein n=1 Tax=Plakobranchus ocellatus TaxID=259542 RepID=A0AAV4D071_9GAST|nr:hypothetical protein PoB_006410200 [Plakobranchus ocellatus]